jgi:hypothetical protein
VYATGPATEGTAVAALVLSIASFVICPVIPAVVALVLASQAKGKINRSGGRVGGQGLVTAATIIAWINIGLAVAVVALIVVIAAFGRSSSSTDNLNLIRTLAALG